MNFSSINLTAVFFAAVAAFVIGFLWHGPLFGAQWIKLMGIPQAEVNAMKAKGMSAMVPQLIAALVQQIVVSIIVAYLAGALRVNDVAGAVMLALLLWLGFIATTLLNGVLWERRTVSLYLFNITYHLVSLVAIAAILVMV